MEGNTFKAHQLYHAMGHFTFWLRPWLNLLAETKLNPNLQA